MGLDHGLDVAEAEAKSFDVVDVACGDAVEGLKDAVPFFAADAYALVGDVDMGVGGVGLEAEGDVGGLGGIFLCIFQKVAQDACEVDGVCLEVKGGGWDLEVEGATPALYGEAEAFCFLVDDVLEVDGLAVEGEFATLSDGGLKDTLDLGLHAGVFGPDDVEVGAGLASGYHVGVFEGLNGEGDGGDGGLEFVGHVVDEVCLHLGELFLAAEDEEGEAKTADDDEGEYAGGGKEEAHGLTGGAGA